MAMNTHYEYTMSLLYNIVIILFILENFYAINIQSQKVQGEGK